MSERFLGLTNKQYSYCIEGVFHEKTLGSIDGNPSLSLCLDDNLEFAVKSSYPIIINPCGDSLQIVPAVFSLSPEWAKQPIGYDSYNVNYSDIKNSRTFRKPFKKSQFCLIPVTAFYADNKESVCGKNNSYNNYIKCDTEDGLLRHVSNEFMLLAGVYEHNPDFINNKHSFAFLMKSAADIIDERLNQLSCQNKAISIQDFNRLPIIINENNADRFLVSNWKYVARCF